MKKTEVSKKVKSILTDMLALDSEPKDADEIVNDLGADSLDAVEVIMECEKQFDIAIPDDQASRAITVAAIVDLVYSILTDE